MVEKRTGKKIDRKEAQAAMLDAIKTIRSDTKSYEKLKAKLKGVESEKERADILLDFVIDDNRFWTILPEQNQVAAVTTVTVTTVLIFTPSAY